MSPVMTYLLIFLSALLMASAGTPVARWLAVRLGVVDRPEARKIHKQVMPRLGGVAIFGAAVVALLLFGERFWMRQAVGILVGATLISSLGLWDDRWGLSPWVKLVGQIGVAMLLVWTDVRVELFPGFWLDVLVTVFWVVGITNAMNLLDNMDGLSGGIAAVASSFFLLLAAMNGQYLVGTLSAALLGACLGFLLYNFNPASIFMGDSGSLFIGFMLAVLGIKLRFLENQPVVTWMIPVMVLGVPIFDTTLVVISRLRRGLNPLTTPGKDHTSHRLVRLGMTHREAVMTLYLVQGALGVAAIFLSQAGIWEAYLLGLLVLGAAIYALIWLERVMEGRGEGRERRPSPASGG